MATLLQCFYLYAFLIKEVVNMYYLLLLAIIIGWIDGANKSYNTRYKNYRQNENLMDFFTRKD